MKTFGLIDSRELVSLPVTAEGLPNVNYLCPLGLHWLDDAKAPWNRPDPDPAPEGYVSPSREPADYPGLLWVAPTVVPLIKLPASHAAHQVASPTLVWFDDRVERQWALRDKTETELAEAARKIWPNVSSFNAEFTIEEKLGIIGTTNPIVKMMDRELTLWMGEVWSNDPRVVQGLDALENDGIINSERRAAIVAKA